MRSGTARIDLEPGRRRPKPGPADKRLREQAAAVYTALSELVRVYQFRDRDRICCHDVSVTQCYALEALLRRGPSSLGELATELYLDKSTASRVVGTLERKGYVVRARHATDGRAIVLTVTVSGRKLHDLIWRDLVDEEARLLAEFEPSVREAAPRLLRRLARAAERRAGFGPPAGCCPPTQE